MDVKNLETFVMVNELKSFTGAARQLGFTQSTVSFQIKQLEKELNAPLFERMNHTVALTHAGERLLPIAIQLLRLAAEAEHIANCAAPEGLVRIAIAESLSTWQFHSRFRDFHRRYPGIRLKIIAASTDVMFQLLDQSQADLVYTLDRHIFDSRYKAAFEAPVPISFVAHPDNPIARQKQISVADMAAQPLLLTEKGMSYRAVLDELLARQGQEAAPLLEVGDTQLIRSLLLQNIGVSFLPEFVIREDLSRGALVRLNVSGVETDIWRQLLYHRNKWLSPEIHCVIDYLRTE